MKSTMKRALSLILTALMLLMLLPGGMAEEMNTASAPVIPGLSDGGALVSEVLGASAEKTAAELLYDRLMACETIDEINAILDGLTEEENALLDRFTDEQNAALEAKVEELGGYGIDDLVDEAYTKTIRRGYSYTQTVSGITSVTEVLCVQKGTTIEEKNITAQKTSNSYTITVSENVAAGDYTLMVKYTVSGNTYTDTVTVRVTLGDFAIKNKMENTEVAYIDFKSGQSTSYALTPVSTGEEIVYASGDNKSGVLVFFIKPKAGYLLTEFKKNNGEDCDLYSVTVNASNSAIEYFRKNSDSAQKLINVAKEAGYLGYFGFSYDGYYHPYAIYSTKAERPEMTVTAEADKTEGVKPGDIVTYTVTITPGHTTTKVDEVTVVSITSLTINGQTEIYSELKENGDGTYTTTVEHIVTDADWAAGDVTLNVAAEVSYSYTITVTDREGVKSTIPTTAIVPNEAEVKVEVAPKNGVKYVVSYEPTDLTLPDIIDTVPYDSNGYFKDGTVPVNSTYGTANPAEGEPANEVDDPTNGGTWTFDGWYKDEALSQKASATEIKLDDGVMYFYGKWSFKKYPTTTVTIKKIVEGNMGDRYKDFTFKVSGSSVADANTSFTLKHNESKTITVNVGDTITVTESGDEGYDVSWTVTATSATDDELVAQADDAYPTSGKSNEAKATINEPTTITFTNTKSATPDTGVLLDSLPYVLILAVVVIVIVLSIVRKRRNDD